MSSVYATEPATSGRVIFETTHGPLEVQLWCRECPKTTKLFLQLCLDGFYDNMVFHRILPNFLVQTGALRDTKQSIDSRDMDKYRKKVKAEEALHRRKYELHSRLRFNHRGQVAMALGVNDDDEEDLQPQFFVTLDESNNLDGKHVLFGTVSGPTIFNAIRISNCDVDETTNQPADLEHAPKIKSVKILENPIHSDISPNEKVPWRVQKEEPKKKKKKRKGKLDVNVLSFGDEMDDGGGEAVVGIKSSHDILQSEKLSKSVDREVEGAVSASNDKHVVEKRKRSKPVEEEPELMRGFAKEEAKGQVEMDFAASKEKEGSKAHDAVQKSVEKPSIANEKDAPKKKSSVVEARRAKYVKGRASKREREEDTMAKLMAFQSKVKDQGTSGKIKSKKDKKESSLASRMARRAQESGVDEEDAVPTYHGQVLEDADDEKEKSSSWLTTKFKCRRHMDHTAKEGKELGGDGRAADDYEVIDEKSKPEGRGHSKHHHHHRKRHKKHHGHGRRDETRNSHKN